MNNLTTFVSHLLDTLESALKPGNPLAPALRVTPDISARASDALARSTAEAAAPTRITDLRNSYEAAFGFVNGLRHGFQETIWQPWRGLTRGDFEAVLVTSATLDMPPHHVLALWLQEGKHAHDQTLHGAAHTLPNMPFASDVTGAQLRSWVRSLIFYQVFGSDAYTSMTPIPGADNELNGAEADHDGRFVAALARLRARKVPAADQFTNEKALIYFSTTAGAFRSLVLIDDAGAPVVGTLPAGVPITGSVSLRAASLGGWLYLQVALFSIYAADMEQLFVDEYGPPIDLRPTPWVTYVGWNGGIDRQYKARFSKRPLGETPEDRIRQLFEEPPAAKLSGAELALYYDGPISRSALGNALQFKYLIEAVQPWFTAS